jgi:S-DNA-T family DNA segregation ATPase FtsK/SpoIIIE
MTRPIALVAAVALIVTALFLSLAMISYSATQIGGASPAGSNLMGLGGAYIAHGLITLWGAAAWLIPIIAVHWAMVLWREDCLPDPGRRLVGVAVLLPALCGLLHLLPIGSLAENRLIVWDQLQLGGIGGAVGFKLCGPPATLVSPAWPGGIVWRYLGTGGTTLALMTLAFCGLLLMDLGLARYLRKAWRELRGRGDRDSSKHISTTPFIPKAEVGPKRRQTTSIQAVAKRIEKIDKRELTVPEDVEALVLKIRNHMKDPAVVAAANPTATAATPTAAESGAVEPLRRIPVEPSSVPPAAYSHEERAESTGATLPATVAQEPWDEAAEDIDDIDDDDLDADESVAAAPRPTPRPATVRAANGEPYLLPPVTLLDVRPARKDAEHELEKNQTAKTIEETFGSFNIGVQVVNAARGPVVTQYEMRLLDQGMRVNKVEGFEKDLQMRLGTEGIRIVAPLPNKNTIGVEVPNRVKEPVVMRDLVEEIDPATMALPIVLGRDAVGRPMIADLSKAPHLLVAGATGMGKSVCMNAMICSILLFKGPDEVKFIMIDPKMVELAGYEDIPHLLTPPITDMTKAHAALEWACKTMDERYEALKATGVRDILSYNALGEDEIRFRLAKKSLRLEDLAHGDARMPYIVVLVDEYADLMMVNKEVEKSIVRLAAKSRACGIHVILTTQRPSADVVTGLIKSNLPCRCCFRVVDKSNSRVVLDVSGAENLLGKGDMLFLMPGTSFPIRGQGVWLKDKEIEAIVEHAKSQGTPTYDDQVLVGAVAMSGDGEDAAPGTSGSEWISDRQFHEAVQCMYRYNRSGADFFRRKMGVGYNKATSFVEHLEDLGFLGPQRGTASREIIKSWDDWIDLIKAQGVSWNEGDDIYLNPVTHR